MENKNHVVLTVVFLVVIGIISLQVYTGATIDASHYSAGEVLTNTCDGDTLTEYYVSNGIPMVREVNCLDGCENGKCK